MTSHAYFLIDAGTLSDSRAVGVVIARILVYLAAKNEAVTWNYEIVDIRARQRAAAVQLRRKVSERKQLTVDAINLLATALNSAKGQHVAAAAHRRPALDILNERLMCLEADVEWEDPSLIRSPTRNSSMRTWTDPTRLNESMSVRSHLYVLGQAPQTLSELDEFVCGPAAQNSQEGDHTNGATLLDKLTKLRDGIIGNGIWESYARKRVGVSWIRPTARETVAVADPVDILIGDLFGCCFEALGGCVMNMADLATDLPLPFASIFAPLHRTRTYPSWSRKFAREISAVVDRFAMEIARDDKLKSESESGSGEPQEWLLQAAASAPQQQQNCLMGSEPTTIRLTRANSDSRCWLRDGRLLRRYDLPEMVALASEYKLSCLRHQAWLDSTAKSLVHLQNVSTRQWYRVVQRLGRSPVIYGLDSRSSSFLGDKVVYAQCPSHSGIDNSAGSALYVAIVPAAGNAAAVYYMDATKYAEIANFGVNGTRLSLDSDTRLIASPFRAAWIEDWAWRDSGDLDVASRDISAIDVGFDESQFECPMSDQMPSDGFMLNSSASADSSTNSLLDTSAEFVIAEAAPELALPSTSTLSEWYSELYLKGLLSPAPDYNRVVDSLASLCSSSASTSQSNVVVETLTNLVLQCSAAIEDTFEVSESTQSADDHGVYRTLRQQAVQATGSDGPSKRAWQVRECQLQILLHLFVIDRLRSQQAADTAQLEETLRDLVDLLCVWASLDDIAIQVEATSSDQKADKCPVSVSEETKDTNDFAAAFVGGSHVGRFASTLGDIVEELRVQCGWVPPATRDERPSQSEQTELLSENKRRKGTPRKIDKSSGERSEVIVHQRNPTHLELSGRKLARHLDELIGGNKGQQQQHRDDASSSEGGSSPSSRVVERRRQSLQPRLPAHLIRQIKSEVVSNSQRAPSSKAVSRAGSNGFACSISSRTLGRSSSTRKKPLRKPMLSAYTDPSGSPSTSSRTKDSCIVSEAASLSKRRRTIMSMPMGSSPPAFLQSSSIVTPSTFICGSDDEDGAPVHTLGSKRALQF